MEALIAVAVMVLILEIREQRAARERDKLDSIIGAFMNHQREVASELKKQVLELQLKQDETIQRLSDAGSLITQIKSEQDGLIKEYELRMRRAEEDLIGQGIDGVNL